MNLETIKHYHKVIMPTLLHAEKILSSQPNEDLKFTIISLINDLFTLSFNDRMALSSEEKVEYQKWINEQFTPEDGVAWDSLIKKIAWYVAHHESIVTYVPND